MSRRTWSHTEFDTNRDDGVARSRGRSRLSRDKSPDIDCFEVRPHRAKVLNAIASWAPEELLHFNYRGASHNPDVRISGNQTGCHVTNRFRRASRSNFTTVKT